jgi:hypothetical protein
VTILKYFFEVQILNIHDLNTNLNYLSSSVHFCTIIVFFDIQNLVLCLTRELIKFIDYKIWLKLQCKTTFNSAFVGKKKSSKSNKNRLWNNVFKKCGFI